MKKVCIIITAFLLVSMKLFVFSVSASTTVVSGESDISIDLMLEKQSKSLDLYAQILERGKLYPQFSDYFGGAYLENGELVVCVLAGRTMDFVSGLGLEEPINIKEVKYSVKEIDDDIEKLAFLVGEYGIVRIGRSDMDNAIVIGVSNQNDELLSAVSEIIDIGKVIIEKSPITISTSTDINIINGNSFKIYGSGFYTEATIGIAAQDSSGNEGIIIPGHVSLLGFGVGDYVYYNNQICGKITKLRFSGSVDAAFVKLRNGFWYNPDFYPTKDFMNGDYYTMANASASYVVQGTFVSMYGYKSGKTTGYITLVNVTITTDGQQLTDTVEASYPAQKGDSGAAILYWRYVGSATSVPEVMGIQSSIGIDIQQNWVASYFTTVDNIFSALDIEDYNP